MKKRKYTLKPTFSKEDSDFVNLHFWVFSFTWKRPESPLPCTSCSYWCWSKGSMKCYQVRTDSTSHSLCTGVMEYTSWRSTENQVPRGLFKSAVHITASPGFIGNHVLGAFEKEVFVKCLKLVSHKWKHSKSETAFENLVLTAQTLMLFHCQLYSCTFFHSYFNMHLFKIVCRAQNS